MSALSRCGASRWLRQPPIVSSIALVAHSRRLASSTSTGGSSSKQRTSILAPTLGVGVAACAAYHYLYRDIRESGLFSWLVSYPGMTLLRLLDAESAHHAGIWAAAHGLVPRYSSCSPPILQTTVWGIPFPNPIGLAAGFDKQAEAMEGLLGAGFGFVEVGTITPLPQPGNPKPRMFRLSEDGAVINRFGFNSDGLAAAIPRLEAYWGGAGVVPGASAAASGGKPHPRRGVVGVNVGKNKEGDVLADYTAGVSAAAPVADYLVVNVSSPNTPGLRNLQQRDQLRSLLLAVMQARDALPWGKPLQGAVGSGPVATSRDRLIAARSRPPPLLLKIAPDIADADLEDIAAVVLETRIDGVICTNTTVERPAYLRSVHAAETGGLSGKPLLESSTRVLSKVYGLTQGRVPIIGVGGVASAADAYRKIRAGASLVQVYSAMALQGPELVPDIASGLATLLAQDGFSTVAEAVGADHRSQATPHSTKQ